MDRGFTVWLTGLSGAGKTTIARQLERDLRARGQRVEVLDGDVVRTNLSRGLGFSREDRDANIRRIGFVAGLLTRNGVATIVAAISPYRETRDEVRQDIGRFVEVHVHCPLEELIRRDEKGLYARALRGDLPNFTGVSDPYEEPLYPEVVARTHLETVDESVAKIVDRLEELDLLPMQGTTIHAHGGRLVSRFAATASVPALRERLPSLPQVRLGRRALCDLEMLATGAFSPLEGFLTRRDYDAVVEQMRLADGRAWPIPITLAVSCEEADSLSEGAEVALADSSGQVLAVLELEERYAYDKTREAALVYRTTDAAHPGVGWLYAQGEVLLGGRVTVVERPRRHSYGHYDVDPAETRRMFTQKGWRRVVGFQTRNPVHRAHEYLQKCALESADGLLLHPLVGDTKDDDIPAAVRLRCYETLLEHYYPTNRVLLAVLPAAMRYAGPREAVQHALVRKNYGCTHFIVGRDHAGVGDYYGTYDAQRIFDEFAPGELGIQPLFFDNAFYCHQCEAMVTEKTCPHSAGERVSLSGTRVRELLRAGELPPAEYTRPEVARILMEAARIADGVS